MCTLTEAEHAEAGNRCVTVRRQHALFANASDFVYNNLLRHSNFRHETISVCVLTEKTKGAKQNG